MLLRRAAVALVTLVATLLAAPAHAERAIEDYAPYQPQTRCSPSAKPGTVELARWMVNRYGGGWGGISRPCGQGGQSEHKEGRAFDWRVDATNRPDRLRVQRFLERLFAADRAGNTDALARRMGVMYVIWNDRIYSAWRGFRAEPYLSSGCRRIRSCSPTLRHRDHLHISITRQAARARTSWYVAHG